MSRSLPEGQRVGRYLKQELHVQTHGGPDCSENPTPMAEHKAKSGQGGEEERNSGRAGIVNRPQVWGQ